MKTPLLAAGLLASSALACLAAGNGALSQLRADDGASAAPVADPVAVPVDQPKALGLDADIPRDARPVGKSQAGDDLFLISKIGDWGSFYANAPGKTPRRWYVAFVLDNPPQPSNFVQLFQDPPTEDHPHPLGTVGWNNDVSTLKTRSQIWRFTKPETASKVGFWALIEYPDGAKCSPFAWWGDSYSKEAAQKACDDAIAAGKTAAPAPEAKP